MDAAPPGAAPCPSDHLLVVPDLGRPACAVAVSSWLVAEGDVVVEGDRVVELVAGGVTLDLESPVSGRLVRQCVDEDTEVSPGDALAVFHADDGVTPA